MNRFVLVLISSLFVLSPVANAAAPAAPAATQQKKAPQKQGKLLFVAMTGLEDLNTLTSSLRHARIAKESGYLSDVVWLSYGRSIVSFDPTVKAVPASVKEELKLAQAAGVELVVCNNSLQKYGIDPKTIEPKARVVPKGAEELARLVSEGYQVIRY